MAAPLNIPFSAQQASGYCLPACAQMALAHVGVIRSQDDLAQALGMFQDYGIPASHLLKLRSRQLHVVYKTEGTIEELRNWLVQQVPVIAFVQTGLLTYWQGQVAQHAVLIVGIEEHRLYLLDPAQSATVIAVHVDEFLLAWDEMEFAFAVIAKQHQ